MKSCSDSPLRKSPSPGCGESTRSRSRRSSRGNGARALARAALIAALVSNGACRDGSSSPPSLAILNARIWTGNPDAPRAEALLIGGTRILAVGTSSAIRAQAGTARIVDATGKFVVPGFIDAHVHFLDGGFRLASVKLRDARTPEEFSTRIGEFASSIPPGVWIEGGDWDHQLWGGELPHRRWIDAITPRNPVWVNRLDGHMALANSLALEAAGITRDTKEVEGGEIVRDPDGGPTGVLKDNAMSLVADVVPPPSAEMSARALEAAMSYVVERGVTSVHHMGSWQDIEVLVRARDEGRLRTRITAAVPLASWERLRDRLATEGRGDDWLAMGMLKGFVDGSLGSHTAAFHAPYDDQPSDRGFFVNSEEDLYRWISRADAASLQVAVHAIGDRANDVLLDVYERVARENGPRDRRFRVEHAQHLSPEAIPRFAALGVVPSMQPYHAIDDGRWAERVIGPVRIGTTYAFRSLLDQTARLAFGSDWFVAPPAPLDGIYAAVTRRTLDDRNPGGWVPEQKITVEEALAAYTRDAAYAAFDEQELGMLKVGYLADLAVIDGDLTSIAPEDIRSASVVMTVVGGTVVHER